MLRSDNDATNLPQIRGTGEEHFRYFIENRLNYCDSKWYAGDYPEDNAVIRIYTPVDENGVPRTDLAVAANANITVTPYSNMYAGVRYKANGTLVQERLEANETFTFVAPNETFNDTETAIYGASQLSSLGDLAPLYLGYIDVGAATKLVELKIGDSTEGYQNNNLYHLAVGTNRLLKKIDIQNCIGFDQALVLTGCPNIEEIYAKGSGITGVELPKSGYLKVLQLPATISNLTLKNQLYIEDLTIEGYETIKTITIENTPVDTLNILDKAINVERVRLTNVDWHLEDTSLLYDFIDRKIGGINENGANTDTMWIDGTCYIETLTGAEYNIVKKAFPYLTITYGTLSSQLTYMNHDGTEIIITQTIQNGEDGEYTGDTPTRESTDQYDFTFSGWSLTADGDANENALKAVEGDRIVYAAYSKTVRNYTVSFYNGDELLESHITPYDGTATYGGETPTNDSTGNIDDFEFIGWKPEPTNITGDTNCYAQFYDKREITDDWGAIAQACLDGTATSKYAIGAYKPLHIGVVELPYDFFGGSAVVWNDEIHIMGGNQSNSVNRNHYKLNGTEWEQVGSLPYSFNNGRAVVYNGEIHLLGGSNAPDNHWKYNGYEWTKVGSLPYRFRGNGSAIVYNNEIHILSSEETNAFNKHYKWNGVEWIEVSTLPFTATSCTHSVVYQDTLYVMGNKDNRFYFFKYANSEWVDLGVTPFNYKLGSLIVYDNRIYAMFELNTGQVTVYEYINSEWAIIDTIPLNNGCSVIYNDQLHILGGNGFMGSSTYKYRDHSYFDGSKWTQFGTTETIPMEVVAHNHDELADGEPALEQSNISTSFTYGRPLIGVIVWNNDLYIIDNTSMLKWDGTSWEQVTTLTLSVCDRNCVLYNNEIHMISGTSHYKWNGTEESEVSTLPITFTGYCSLVVYNNEIHLFEQTSHYKWDGTEWTLVGDTPFTCCTSGEHKCSAIVYNDKIYVIGAGENIYLHKSCYSWDGEEWVNLLTSDIELSTAALAVYEDVMYMFAPKGDKSKYYKWVNTEWIEIGIDVNMQGTFSADPVAFVYRGKLYVYTAEYNTSVAPNVNTTRIAVLSNPKASLTFVAKNLLKDAKQMNDTATNNGGWSETTLRAYLNDDFVTLLPSDLQTSIAEVKKLSDGGYNNPSIIFSNDMLWIPSADELGCEEQEYYVSGQGNTYSVFTDNASRRRTNSIAKKDYFTRTSNITDNTKFVGISSSGNLISSVVSSWNGYYTLIGFCI